MKRLFAAILLSSVFNAVVAGQAADAVTIAAQQEAEERMKRLAATIEEVQTAQAAMQRQFSALSAEVSKLRDDVARNNNNAATQESLKRLSDQIVKVDESRIAGDKVLQEALKDLGKTITTSVAAPPRPARVTGPETTNPTLTNPSHATLTSNAKEEGFEYVVQSGDRLDTIVKAYRDQGIMVTRASVMAANPSVDWSRLQPKKTKIFIPKPK